MTAGLSPERGDMRVIKTGGVLTAYTHIHEPTNTEHDLLESGELLLVLGLAAWEHDGSYDGDEVIYMSPAGRVYCSAAKHFVENTQAVEI